ncbi:cation diffusion facilitator family transporter [Nitrosovibrio tenuis]|uniref:Cobalt-zinc-cadmium efflux system protein n=1 Tax=Nitrosovibrio tenuis TaxID=1233 RepID=A0A1H7IEY5_9PROT|nr:cation diffusion facilitator family transporter [Nitrosovibrio tenuis]SEK60327.1 cobalt-zinc-cadmium efflux system protein [Nitrosovibrio tenuis]
MRGNYHNHEQDPRGLALKAEPGSRRHAAIHGNERGFPIAIALNHTFVMVEFGYGFAANSMALMADAGHNLSDVLSLILAWGASILARREATERYTYGLRSTSILAALANAMLLLVVCGAIAWEAVQRFSQAPVVAGITVTFVATAGVIINGLSAWLFLKGSQGDLNIQGAYLHMAMDAAVSAGVIASGIAIIFTGWYWLDPVISLVIVAAVIFSTWGLLRDSVRLILSAVPANIDIAAIDAYLRQQPGVADVHDLHIWGISTTESVLTVHLVMPGGYPGDAFMEDIRRTLESRYAIHHSTIQVEQGTATHFCTVK